MTQLSAADSATRDSPAYVDTSPTSIVLDTDIGTDVDDILALAVILGSPELSLSGVTTVYGDVELRARMVARAIRSAGASLPPIVPGRSQTRSGRPVWWPGHEGRLMHGLEDEAIDSGDAVAVLAASETVVGIGPLTDLAALAELPGRRTSHAYLMGGDFGAPSRVEHNIRCDVAAADVVFRSSLQLTVVGLDQTERVRIDARMLDRIADAGEFGAMLAAEVQQFWRFAEQDYNVPHDAIAVLSVIRPDLFTFSSGVIEVDTSGESAELEGMTRFTSAEGGRHRIVTDLDTAAVSDEIVRRILRSTRHSSTPLNEENHR
ncbi:nucleoside hydrolase [Leifsonia sp. NPDC102414]|uniref:nucleoside hydrolase n=1 Tax=Leifsonia sp. NPDC102414 TaxID=3364124 RepID=UPI0037F5A636